MKNWHKVYSDHYKWMFLCIKLSYSIFLAKHRHKIVTYWGQNAVYNSMKARQYWEKDLVEFCRDYNYDVIALSFLNVFFERRNKGKKILKNKEFYLDIILANIKVKVNNRNIWKRAETCSKLAKDIRTISKMLLILLTLIKYFTPFSSGIRKYQKNFKTS